jgi:hypothetical protein
VSDFFFTQGSIDFSDGTVNVGGGAFTVMSFEGAFGVLQQMAGFSQHLVGLPLAFAVGSIAFEFEVQSFASGLDVFECFPAMAAVIVVCVFEENIGMDDFVTRRLGVNASAE